MYRLFTSGTLYLGVELDHGDLLEEELVLIVTEEMELGIVVIEEMEFDVVTEEAELIVVTGGQGISDKDLAELATSVAREGLGCLTMTRGELGIIPSVSSSKLVSKLVLMWLSHQSSSWSVSSLVSPVSSWSVSLLICPDRYSILFPLPHLSAGHAVCVQRLVEV